MDRREFLAAATAVALWRAVPSHAQVVAGDARADAALAEMETSGRHSARPYDARLLVVARGTDPRALVDRGLRQLGGIGKLVKRGSSVVVKPNFSVAQPPQVAATTNPALVAAVVRQCLAAGAREVKVVDNSFSGPQCLVLSGIQGAVSAAGGKAFYLDSPGRFTRVDMKQSLLRGTLFSTDVLKSDVLISMPVLKHHVLTGVTMSLKNMMGLVWDRGYFHRTDLFRTIAELNAYRRADLVIMDALRGIVDNGPTGPGRIRQWGQVVFGTDPVAVDAYGATLFGAHPAEIGYIVDAARLGVGEMNLKRLTVKKV